jgi:hypothetical protein
MVCGFSALAMKRRPLLEPKRPRVRDALHDEMSGILDRRKDAGVEPRGRPIRRRGRGALEELVRPLVVVLGAEAIERALLGRRGSGALILNAEPQPPDIERRQAVNPGRREGDTIVGANRVRQAVLAEQPVKDRAHAESLGREQAVTRE